MAKARSWSASPPPTEIAPVSEVLETKGSKGATPAVADASNLLIFGKRQERLRPAKSKFSLESVIGPDDRVHIVNSDQYPWRMIAALELIPRPPLTSGFIGTGWFIGPKTLLTAGHCVYSDRDYDGWIGSIRVSPGRNGGSFPFNTVTATRFATLDDWKSSSDPDYDIGCIQLDQPLGDTVGFFKIASMTDAQLANALVNISGYPGDLSGGDKQYFHANRVLRTSAKRVYYDVDTFGGQSGSPVWHQATADSEPVAIAVHAYGVGGGGPTANSGPRLRPDVVATIKEWLAAA